MGGPFSYACGLVAGGQLFDAKQIKPPRKLAL